MKRSLIFILVFFAINSCKKYPEGGSTFRAKSALCSGHWINFGSRNYITGGWASHGTSSDISFGVDGTFHGEPSSNPNIELGFDGSWEFTDKKSKIKITDSNGNTFVYTIVALIKKDKLIFQNDSIINSYEPGP